MPVWAPPPAAAAGRAQGSRALPAPLPRGALRYRCICSHAKPCPCGDSPSTRLRSLEPAASIKRVSANRCNRLLGNKGTFWMDESYDHIIRNAAELATFAITLPSTRRKRGSNSTNARSSSETCNVTAIIRLREFDSWASRQDCLLHIVARYARCGGASSDSV